MNNVIDNGVPMTSGAIVQKSLETERVNVIGDLGKLLSAHIIDKSFHAAIKRRWRPPLIRSTHVKRQPVDHLSHVANVLDAVFSLDIIRGSRAH